MGAAARLRVSYLALVYTIIAPIRLAFGKQHHKPVTNPVSKYGTSIYGCVMIVFIVLSYIVDHVNEQESGK